MKNHYLVLLVIAFGFVACQNNTKSELTELNLLQYNIPLTVLAPDSAKVVSGTLSFSQDVTIKSPKDNYDVQIFAYDATTNNLAEVKAGHLAEVKSSAYFSKIIKEEDAGFIYETAFDSTSTNYGFKYLKLQGDKEYIFQTGLVGTFELAEVEWMYEAVKNEK
ncbi:MAG: hypothetical protein AAF960_28490 [Bacteroidota bacterium]